MNMYMYAHARMHMYVCTCTYAHVCMHMHVCTLYVCTLYVYMYICIHTCKYIKYTYKTNVPNVNVSVLVFSFVSTAPHVSHTYRDDDEDDDISVYYRDLIVYTMKQ